MQFSRPKILSKLSLLAKNRNMWRLGEKKHGFSGFFRQNRGMLCAIKKYSKFTCRLEVFIV
jgi:hypothetical protein